MTTKTRTKNTWSTEDKQAFADRNILRAQTITNKKKQANKRVCRNRLITGE